MKTRTGMKGAATASSLTAGDLGHDHDDEDGVVNSRKTIRGSSYSSLAGRFLLRLRSLEISSSTAGIGIGFFCLLLCLMALYSSPISPPPAGSFSPITSPSRPALHEIGEDPELIKVLQRAKMTTTVGKGTMPPSEVVILTIINKAWAEPGSLLDLFLESFWSGNGTRELVRQLLIVSLDLKAHQYCQAVHPHCYALTTPGVNFTGTAASYMTDEYLLMMWRRMEFYTSLLSLGIDFVFTDADIVWLRNPFPHFHEHADFQVACDYYSGNDSDLHNAINGGFIFVRSNVRTRRFYEFWYESRDRFPGSHDQEVFNKIKFDPFVHDDIGLRVKFLDTKRFGGICQSIKDLDVGCTMHATCCVGLEVKIRALRAILQDWKHFSSSPLESRNSTAFAWKPERTGCWGGG